MLVIGEPEGGHMSEERKEIKKKKKKKKKKGRLERKQYSIQHTRSWL